MAPAFAASVLIAIPVALAPSHVPGLRPLRGEPTLVPLYE
jgi:hypothetical protein